MNPMLLTVNNIHSIDSKYYDLENLRGCKVNNNNFEYTGINFNIHDLLSKFERTRPTNKEDVGT